MGPRNGPQAARCSSRRGGAVARLCVARRRWGPEMAPKPPDVRRAPAEPWRASVWRDGDGAPKWPPGPPTFVAPRRSRGAPLCGETEMRAREMAPRPPDVRRAAGEPWRASVLRDGDAGPRNGPQASRRSSRRGGAVARLYALLIK